MIRISFLEDNPSMTVLLSSNAESICAKNVHFSPERAVPNSGVVSHNNVQSVLKIPLEQMISSIYLYIHYFVVSSKE